MSGPRVCLVTQAFWPQTGARLRYYARLAQALVALGADVTLVVRRWHDGWPRQFAFRDIWVQRVPDRMGMFANWNWRKSLRNWVSSNAHNFDVVLAWSDASAIASVCRSEGLPLIDLNQATEGGRNFPVGVPLQPPPNEEERRQSREALSDLSTELRLPSDAPLVICFPVSFEPETLGPLLNQWKQLISRMTDARLWLIGHRGAARALRLEISAMQIADRVLLPGGFDDPSDLYKAANGVLSFEPATDAMTMLETLAHGVPLIATHDHSFGCELSDQDAALIFEQDVSESLLCSVQQIVSQPPLARRLTEQGQRYVDERFNWEQCVEEHWQAVLQSLDKR